MAAHSQQYTTLLRTSLDQLEWALSRLPETMLTIAPRPGRWSAARIVFHLLCYEQRIALPTMRQWLGDPAPPAHLQEEDAAVEERDWADGADHPLTTMLADLRVVRADQIGVIAQVEGTAWQEERAALWGAVTLEWVVTKTFQHTLEHTDEILRNVLWGRPPAPNP